jgi:hypothetical protein
LDRGIATDDNLMLLRKRQQSYLVGTPRSRLTEFEAELSVLDWSHVKEHVEVACVKRDGQSYVSARSKQRRASYQVQTTRSLPSRSRSSPAEM